MGCSRKLSRAGAALRQQSSRRDDDQRLPTDSKKGHPESLYMRWQHPWKGVLGCNTKGVGGLVRNGGGERHVARDLRSARSARHNSFHLSS